MFESRQQRRARERAEAKGQAWSPSGSPPKRLAAYEVDFYRSDEQEDEEDPGWSAEGGLELSSSGEDYEWRTSLADLVAEIVQYATHTWGDRFDLRFVWRLDGDETAMATAGAAAGVDLPATVSTTR